MMDRDIGAEWRQWYEEHRASSEGEEGEEGEWPDVLIRMGHAYVAGHGITLSHEEVTALLALCNHLVELAAKLGDAIEELSKPEDGPEDGPEPW